jgi:hypothetical protein
MPPVVKTRFTFGASARCSSRYQSQWYCWSHGELWPARSGVGESK